MMKLERSQSPHISIAHMVNGMLIIVTPMTLFNLLWALGGIPLGIGIVMEHYLHIQ